MESKEYFEKYCFKSFEDLWEESEKRCPKTGDILLDTLNQSVHAIRLSRFLRDENDYRNVDETCDRVIQKFCETEGIEDAFKVSLIFAHFSLRRKTRRFTEIEGNEKLRIPYLFHVVNALKLYVEILGPQRKKMGEEKFIRRGCQTVLHDSKDEYTRDLYYYSQCKEIEYSDFQNQLQSALKIALGKQFAPEIADQEARSIAQSPLRHRPPLFLSNNAMEEAKAHNSNYYGNEEKTNKDECIVRACDFFSTLVDCELEIKWKREEFFEELKKAIQNPLAESAKQQEFIQERVLSFHESISGMRKAADYQDHAFQVLHSRNIPEVNIVLDEIQKTISESYWLSYIRTPPPATSLKRESFPKFGNTRADQFTHLPASINV